MTTDPTGQGSNNIRGSVTFAEALEVLASGEVLLNIDGGLHAFNPEGESLTSMAHTFAGTVEPKPISFGSNGKELFWTEEGATLYRTEMASHTVLTLDDPGDEIAGGVSTTNMLAIGDDKVAWSYTRGPIGASADVIRVTDVDATSPAQADDLASASQITLALPSTQNTNDWVFYTEMSGGGLPKAIAKRSDGSDTVEYSNASWVGVDVTRFSVAGPSSSMFQRVLFVDGMSGISSFHGGGNLKSIDADAPGGTVRNLGQIPADVVALMPFSGFGPSRLSAATSTDGDGSFETDVFWFDSSMPGSLRRLTDTNSSHETPVPFS